MIALAIGWLVAGAVMQTAPAASRDVNRDVCALLAVDEIRAVQGSPVEYTKRSDDSSEGLHFAQCFLATTDFARSVNVTLMSGDTKAYWAKTFARPRPASKKKDPPRPIDGTGDEAFWTGDSRAGALYVLSGDHVLRISVGGVDQEDERIRRSRALAQAALGRLK